MRKGKYVFTNEIKQKILNEYILIGKKTHKQFPPKDGEVRVKTYKKKGVETFEWFSWINGKWKYYPTPDEYRKPRGLAVGTIVEDKLKNGKIQVRQKQEDGSWKRLPLPEKYRSNYENFGLPEGTIRVKGTRTYQKQNRDWVIIKRRPKKSEHPEGAIRHKGVKQQKINGEWVTLYKDRKDYIVPEDSPIGKSGPRPELRTLIYGVGINDVMIPEFSESKTCRVWRGILRRSGKRDPNMHNYEAYKDCTCDPRWFKLSAFKEWIEQWDDFENKEVDKDILIPGNLHYGPDTCLMVRSIVNSWFKPTDESKSDLPRGVCWNTNYKKGKSPKPYRAQISPLQVIDGEVKVGKRTGLGHFLTVKDASDAFQKARQESLQILIDTETDIKVRDAILQYIIS